MIRVTLLSTDVTPTSGWGSITYELCREFSRRDDVSFDLHLPRGVAVNGDVTFSARIHRTLPSWRGSFGRRPYRALPFLFPRVALQDTDVVHTLIEFPYGILARRLAQAARVPYIIMTQGTYGVAPLFHGLDRWFYRTPLRQAAFVTAPSHFTADVMCRAGALERDISVIHNAVNYERFQRPANLRAIRSRYGLPEEARVVLGVGALKRRKGFDTLLRAFARVAQDEPLARLVIAGEGEARTSLEELSVSLGIREQTHLVGSVPGDDLVGLYQLCEVYSHLPRNVQWNFEGFGLVYLEAGACGKPVVATRSGGVADAVLDGETGILVDEEAVEAAAAAILRLLQDQELACSLGEAGRRYAAQHSWAWYADQMVRLYQEAISWYQAPQLCKERV